MFKKYSVHTCFCDGMLSEGKLWDDLLRGGGCGGASRFDGEAVWDVAVIGISGSCIFTTEVGWIGTAPCGLSGSGRIGDPINPFNYFLSSNTKNGFNNDSDNSSNAKSSLNNWLTVQQTIKFF